MNKKLLASMIAVLGVGALGMYISAQALDKAYVSYVEDINQNDDLQLTMETQKNSFFARETHFVLQQDDMSLLAFSDKVSFLPWGAKGRLTIDQNSGLINELREDFAFDTLPLSIHWKANGLSQRVHMNMQLDAFELEAKNTQDKKRETLQIKPLESMFALTLEGQPLSYHVNWQGATYYLPSSSLNIGKVALQGEGELVDELTFFTQEHLNIESIKLERSYGQARNLYEVLGFSFTQEKDKQAELVNIKQKVGLNALNVEHARLTSEMPRKALKLNQASFDLGINALPWSTLKNTQMLLTNVPFDETQLLEVFEQWLAQGLNFDYNMHVEQLDMAGLLDEAAQGHIRADGHIAIEAMGLEQAMRNPFTLLRKLKGELNLDMHASFAKALWDEWRLALLMQQGYVTIENDTFKTKLALSPENGLTANGVSLGF